AGRFTASSSGRAWSSSISGRLKALTGGRANDTTAVSCSHATRMSVIAGHRTAPRGRMLRSHRNPREGPISVALPASGGLAGAAGARYTNYTFVSTYGADSDAPYKQQQRKRRESGQAAAAADPARRHRGVP